MVEVLRIDDKLFTLEELIQKVKTKGWSSVVKPWLIQTIVENYALANKLLVSDEELQDKFDSFRKWNGLYSVEETERWLVAKGITLEDLEKELEVELWSEKIKTSTPREEVERFFAENKLKMDGVELSKLTVKEQEVAVELLAQLTEDEADFMLLARDYSIDERARFGGYVGVVQRGDLNSEVAPQIFGVQEGDVLGPYSTQEGFYLIQVNKFKPAVLDEQKEKEIRNILFEEINHLVQSKFTK